MPFRTLGVADTGAMMVVLNVGVMKSLRLREEDLIPVSLKIAAANKSEIKLLGGILIIIRAFDENGRVRASRQLIYVADGCSGVFLSQRVCKDLRVIPEDFPKVGNFNGTDDCSGRMTRRRSSSEPQGVAGCGWREFPPAVLAASLSDSFEKNDKCYDCVNLPQSYLLI